MAIRLNKVAKDFNIGISTIAEYLKKKGFGQIDENPNTKITDEQYDALRKEFRGDKDLAERKEKMIMGRQRKEKKPDLALEPAEIETVVPEDLKPKVLGKIDLSTVGKPAVAKPQQPVSEQPVSEPSHSEEKEVEPEPVDVSPVEEENVPVVEEPVAETKVEPQAEAVAPVEEEAPAGQEKKGRKPEVQTIEENGVIKIVPEYESKIKVFEVTT